MDTIKKYGIVMILIGIAVGLFLFSKANYPESNALYHCDDCAIEKTCFDGCGFTHLGNLISMIGIVYIIIGVSCLFDKNNGEKE